MPNENSDGYERLADVAAGMKKECQVVPSVLQDVIKNYAELSNVIQDFYKENFKNLPQHVDQLVNEIGHSVQNAKEEAITLYDQLTDLDPVAPSIGVPISKMFANSTVLLLIAAISSFIGSYVLAPLFGVIFLKFGAVLIALFLIPLIARYSFFNRKVLSLSTEKKRVVCATFVFEQSLLIGFVNQSDWLDTPFSVGTQLVVSFMFPMMLAHTVQREKILAAVAGSCMLLHLVHGVLSLSGLTVGFIVVAVLYTILALALIQYAIAHHKNPDSEKMHVAMQYVFAVSAVKMLSLMAFGGEE